MGEHEHYKFAIAVGGTRGDFQPYLALGVYLARLGHKVRFWSSVNHCETARLFEDFGIGADPVSGDITEMLRDEVAMHAMEQGDFLLIAKRKEGEEEKEPEKINGKTVEELREEAKHAFAEFQPQAYITNGLGHLGEFEEELRKDEIVRVDIGLQQQSGPPSNAFTSIMWEREFPEPDTPPICSHIWFAQQMAKSAHGNLQWMFFSNPAEKDSILEIPGPETVFKDTFDYVNRLSPKILAYSPHVFPPPDDWPDVMSDKSATQIVGNLRFTRSQQDALAKEGNTFFSTGEAHEVCKDFLRSGPPPVYVGWGSMIVYGSEHMTRLAVEALKIANQRGIILGGWAQLSAEALEGDAPGSEELRAYAKDHILFMKSAPHEWLFPQCCCCVHHGGVGTMQASLGGGTPTIITPVFADQESNATALEKGGWGVKTSKLGKLKAQELGEAIRKVCSDPSYKERTTDLFNHMEQEDGIAKSAEIILRVIREELLTGKYKEKRLEERRALREIREKQLVMSTDMVLAKWNSELNKRFPAWAEFNKRNMKFAVTCQDALTSGRLWCVSASSVLAREGQDLKSKEAGRFKRYAFLEQTEKKGSRLYVKRLKGFGPDVGWVSPTASGKDILENITDMARVTAINMEMYNDLFKDIMPPQQ